LSRKQKFNYWKKPEKTARYDSIINECVINCNKIENNITHQNSLKTQALQNFNKYMIDWRLTPTLAVFQIYRGVNKEAKIQLLEKTRENRKI
jgi:hypothetical protein